MIKRLPKILRSHRRFAPSQQAAGYSQNFSLRSLSKAASPRFQKNSGRIFSSRFLRNFELRSFELRDRQSLIFHLERSKPRGIKPKWKIKKSQSAIEFIVLIGAVLFFFLILASSFQQNITDRSVKQRNLAVRDIANSVQSEINLASKAVDGYQRVFSIPQQILTMDYNITLEANFVLVQTQDLKISTGLPIKNITGQIQKGDNVIRKINGEIFLNS